MSRIVEGLPFIVLGAICWPLISKGHWEVYVAVWCAFIAGAVSFSLFLERTEK